MSIGKKRETVELTEYCEDWPILYSREAGEIGRVIGSHILEIHHIGSTSIPGLCAKPIIDIAIGVASFEAAVGCVAAMESLGYVYRGENGIPRRHYFVKGDPRTFHSRFRIGGPRLPVIPPAGMTVIPGRSQGNLVHHSADDFCLDLAESLGGLGQPVTTGDPRVNHQDPTVHPAGQDGRIGNHRDRRRIEQNVLISHSLKFLLKMAGSVRIEQIGRIGRDRTTADQIQTGNPGGHRSGRFRTGPAQIMG